MDDSTSLKRVPENPGQAPSTATPNPQDRPIIRLNLNRSTKSPPSVSTQIPSTPRAKKEPNIAGVSPGNGVATATARQYQRDERTDAAPGASGTAGKAVTGSSSSTIIAPALFAPFDVLTRLDGPLTSGHVFQLFDFQQNLLSDLSLLQGEFYNETKPDDNVHKNVFQNSGFDNIAPFFEFESRIKRLYNQVSDRERAEDDGASPAPPQFLASEHIEYEECAKLANEKRDQLTALRSHLEGDDGYVYPLPVVYKLIGNQTTLGVGRPKSRKSKGKQLSEGFASGVSPIPSVDGGQGNHQALGHLGSSGGQEMKQETHHHRASLVSPLPASNLPISNFLLSAGTTDRQPCTASSHRPASRIETLDVPDNHNKRKTPGARSSSEGDPDESLSKQRRKKSKEIASGVANRGNATSTQQLPAPATAPRAQPIHSVGREQRPRAPLPEDAFNVVANPSPARHQRNPSTRAALSAEVSHLEERMSTMQHGFEVHQANSMTLLNSATALVGYKDVQIGQLNGQIAELHNRVHNLQAAAAALVEQHQQQLSTLRHYYQNTINENGQLRAQIGNLEQAIAAPAEDNAENQE